MKKTKGRAKRTTNAKRDQESEPTLGERIVEGLGEAIEWSRGENASARAAVVQVPRVDVGKARRKVDLAKLS